MKKLITIGLILIALSCSVAAISATESSTSSQTTLVNNDLTINGIHFKIPDGYDEVEKDTDNFMNDDINKTEDIDGTVVDLATTEEFKNGAGAQLKIEVGIKANDAKIESINPTEFTPKEIKGKTGFIKNDDGKVKFEYLQDGKLVKIEANSENIINQVIV
jgi:hypothetical protein